MNLCKLSQKKTRKMKQLNMTIKIILKTMIFVFSKVPRCNRDTCNKCALYFHKKNFQSGIKEQVSFILFERKNI